MENVKIEESGNDIIIRIDKTHRGPRSKSGKTIRVASTEGNIDVPGNPGMKIGLNVYVKE